MSTAAETRQGRDHARQMDGMYRYQRHIYDLTRKYYLLGRDRAIGSLNIPRQGTLLEVGCGTGRNLLLAHKLYPTAGLYGLDISAEMLTSARRNFRAVAQQPVFKVADASAFTAGEFSVNGFDRVMISYAISMIPEWEKAIDQSLAALTPGGSLHIVDFGQQDGLPRWFKTSLQSWLQRFHVTPRLNLRDVLLQKSEAIGGRLEFETIGRGYAWHGIIRT